MNDCTQNSRAADRHASVDFRARVKEGTAEESAQAGPTTTNSARASRCLCSVTSGGRTRPCSAFVVTSERSHDNGDDCCDGWPTGLPDIDVLRCPLDTPGCGLDGTFRGEGAVGLPGLRARARRELAASDQDVDMRRREQLRPLRRGCVCAISLCRPWELGSTGIVSSSFCSFVSLSLLALDFDTTTSGSQTTSLRVKKKRVRR